MVRSEMEVVLRCKNHVRVDALTVVDFTTLLACAAGGNWVGVLYCFGSGAARRVGIQVNLKIPRGFATRFAWRLGRQESRAPDTQPVCVTRFDQSECVICRLIFALGKSRFQRYMWFSLYSKLVSIISTLYTAVESCWNTLS